MAIQKVVESLHDKVTQTELDFQHIFTGLLLVPVLYVLINEFVRSGARIANLKGPRGLPLIGNLHQIRVNAAEQYRRWAKKYGGVYQIQLGNIPIVVVNTAESAKVIFGNNALSSRPEFYTFHKVCIFGSHSTSKTNMNNQRYFQTRLAPQLVLLLIAIRSKGAERAPHLPSTDLPYRPIFRIWILRPKTLSRSYSSMAIPGQRELIQCQ